MRALVMAACAAFIVSTACSDEAGSKPSADVAERADGASSDDGTELRVEVPEKGRVYVKLATPEVTTLDGDATSSTEWDIAFEGFDVYTNSGVSGPGKAAGFGPIESQAFAEDQAPEVPFLTQDSAGGAFLEWYAYEEETHAIWSRFHVYGVRDGSRLWKVQVLTYYGQRDGAAVSALYKIRYAELGGEASELREVSDIDATAGGVGASEDAPSECLDLASGERAMLTPDDALTSSAWHLCFRRQSISVNGGVSGPRGVTAVDLSAEEVAGEKVEDLMERTADSERAAFDDVTASSFEEEDFRSDGVVTAFSDAWIDADESKRAPADGVWVVQDAAGEQQYLLDFRAFEDATSKSPGSVVLRVKRVKGMMQR
jgi:hypothetical protein